MFVRLGPDARGPAPVGWRNVHRVNVAHVQGFDGLRSIFVPHRIELNMNSRHIYELDRDSGCD